MFPLLVQNIDNKIYFILTQYKDGKAISIINNSSAQNFQVFWFFKSKVEISFWSSINSKTNIVNLKLSNTLFDLFWWNYIKYMHCLLYCLMYKEWEEHDLGLCTQGNCWTGSLQNLEGLASLPYAYLSWCQDFHCIHFQKLL